MSVLNEITHVPCSPSAWHTARAQPGGCTLLYPPHLGTPCPPPRRTPSWPSPFLCPLPVCPHFCPHLLWRSLLPAPPSFLLRLLSGSSGPALLLGKASSVQSCVVAAPMGSGGGLSPSQTRLGNHEDKPWCGGGSGWRFLRSPAEDRRKSGVAVSGSTHGDSMRPDPGFPLGV